MLTLAGGSAWSATPVKPAAPKDDLGKKGPATTIDQNLAGDITRKKATAAAQAPGLKVDQFTVQVELQVASKRHEQIEYLQKIIQLGADDKEMPKLLFRLAELYWEESKYYFFESQRKTEEVIKAQDNKDTAGAQHATEEKNALVARSQKFQDEAVNRYKEIVKNYPNFERMDEVFYFLGHNLWEAAANTATKEEGQKKEEEALAIYKLLITKFPKSKYIPDAWLAFGEHFFNGSAGKKDELAKALTSYKKAAEFQDSAVYGFALYKQAWCYYNMADWTKALDTFKAVIFYGEYASSVNHENKTALVKEARKDYVLTYSHFGDPLGAEDDFKKVGGADNWEGMFKGLAGLYYDDGKDKEAVLTYRRLIQLKPLSPEAPLFQSRIVDAVMRVGKKQITLEQVRTLVKIIQDVKNSGVIKTDPDKKALAEAEELSERTMSNLAVNWHTEARKTRDDPTFVLANEVYSDYLTIFPDSKKSYDLRFFWAELLNDNLNKYDKAAEQYSMVVGIDAKRIEAKQKPGKWLQNAALDAVLANDEVVKKFTDPLPKADPKNKSQIPPPKQKLIDACNAYIKYVPKGEKVVEIQYKVAKIYYDYNWLDEASKGFDDICIGHPEHEVAEFSCNLVLDIKNLRDDLPGVYDTAKKYLANEALIKAHPKLKPDLTDLLEKTSFKLVSQYESQGKYVAAAKKYLAYVDEFPKGSLSDTALYNASVDFFKGHHFDESIAARTRLTKEFPNSKYVPDALYNNAEAAESVGDFEAAAEAYEEYTKRFQKQSGLSGGLKAMSKSSSHNGGGKHGGKHDKHEDKGAAQASNVQYDEAKAQIALYNAGVFREGLGQIKAALNDRQLYLDMWPNAKDSEQVFLSIASLYERQNSSMKAANQYLDYEKNNLKDPEKVLTAEAKICKIYEKTSKKSAQKKREEMLKYYDKLYSNQKKKIEGLALEQIAWAHYDANEPYFDDYKRIKLKLTLSDPKAFKKALADKGEHLKDVQKRYTETVNLKAGGPAICALNRIGEAYANFAEALANMPMPKGLNQEQQDGVREQLEEQAKPLQSKAGEAFQLAVSKSRELNIYNDCSEKALGQLAEKYAPDQFPKVTESYAEIKGLPEQKSGQSVLLAVQPLPTKNPEDEQEKPEQIAVKPSTEGENAPAQAPGQKVANDNPKAENPDDHPPGSGGDEKTPTPNTPKTQTPPSTSSNPSSTPTNNASSTTPNDEPTDVVN
jgi:tetratricopeptide (TPR) repeat protein